MTAPRPDALSRAHRGALGWRCPTRSGVDIFPVNFGVKERIIDIRSAPGSKLSDVAHAASVAFEIDGSRGRTHWSVVVHGTAERMSRDSEIVESGVLDLKTMTSSAKGNYVRIIPSAISGRRFRTLRRRA